MASLSITSPPGEPDDLSLDHEDVPYAGHFGRERTGTAVFETDDEEFLGAISFSPDRADDRTCRIRHLAVLRARQGEGIATQLASAFLEWALETGYDQVKITVLNPFALVAVARAGFAVSGERGPTGGVVLVAPGASTRSVDWAMAQLATLELTEPQRRYVHRRLDQSDPADER